jgi:hypothetical protein
VQIGGHECLSTEPRCRSDTGSARLTRARCYRRRSARTAGRVHPHQVDGASTDERGRGHATDSRHAGCPSQARAGPIARPPAPDRRRGGRRRRGGVEGPDGRGRRPCLRTCLRARSGTRRHPVHERDGRVGRRSGPEPSGDPLGVWVASGGPVSSRPRCALTSGPPLASHPSRAVTHQSGCHSCCAGCDGHRRRVTARHGVRSSVGPQHRHTPGGITAPCARRHTPSCGRSPAPAVAVCDGEAKRPHRHSDASPPGPPRLPGCIRRARRRL